VQEGGDSRTGSVNPSGYTRNCNSAYRPFSQNLNALLGSCSRDLPKPSRDTCPPRCPSPPMGSSEYDPAVLRRRERGAWQLYNWRMDTPSCPNLDLRIISRQIRVAVATLVASECFECECENLRRMGWTTHNQFAILVIYCPLLGRLLNRPSVRNTAGMRLLCHLPGTRGARPGYLPPFQTQSGCHFGIPHTPGC